MRSLPLLLPLLLALAAMPMPSGAHDRELVLAGGALHICSSLALRDCRDASAVTAPGTRGESMYRLHAAGIEDAARMRLRSRDGLDAATVAAWLRNAHVAIGDAPVPRARLVDALRAACMDAARTCGDGDASPWEQLDDASRDALLSALEMPQLDVQGRRARERASLAASRRDDGPAILREFVARAALRTDGARPRIAIVTASAFDSFDPVDMYLDALQQAGADVEWWPVDAALAAAVFEDGGCDALPTLRRERLQLAGREHVFPDLASQQLRACRDPAALRTLPARVHGIFFTGGDQFRLRRAFYGSDDQPNAWLLALREAVARGDVVVAGTSAGSAVQSGAPMLSNGTPSQALEHGAHRADPPAPGCTRARSCGALDEDALTYAPVGLGLAPGLVVDTHFSERARELRLVELLAATGHARGIGIDETSALHLRWDGDAPVLRALGAHGVWAIDTVPGCVDGAREVRLHYLAPGTTWRWELQGGMTPMHAPASMAVPDAHATPPVDALADGALRTAAAALAFGATLPAMHAGGRDVRIGATPASARWSAANGTPGITEMRLRLKPARGCTPR